MSNSKKRQVLLCGTQYGQTYLPAIFESKEFELAGILAQGSDRSVRLSEQCGVELYTTTVQLDRTFDLACVAINESVGTVIGIDLLKQHIPILLENPVSLKHMIRLLECADEFKVACHVNSHFPELPPVADFIRRCKAMNTDSQAFAVNVQCNSRTLFSALDILLRCFGMFDPVDMQVRDFFCEDNVCNEGDDDSGSQAYNVVSYLIGDIPCSLLYQRWRHDVDDSTDSPLGHQITVTYPDGVLMLCGTFGPCLWFPLVVGDLSAERPIYSLLNNAQQNLVNTHEIVRWRTEANRQVMRELDAASRDVSLLPYYQQRDYLLQLCGLWSRFFLVM